MPTSQLTRDQVITMLDGLIDKDVNLYTTHPFMTTVAVKKGLFVPIEDGPEYAVALEGNEGGILSLVIYTGNITSGVIGDFHAGRCLGLLNEDVSTEPLALLQVVEG